VIRIFGIGALLLAGWLQPTVAAALSCSEAAATAEKSMAVPHGLLLAIGNVESGRTDPAGTRTPWPWTINSGGIGRFFAGAKEAVLAARALQAAGVQSIDIGCFQINLLHHPDAFLDLATGFDPLANATAAARFLLSLHEEFGAWELAIAAYHSRLDTLGAPYRDRVLAVWHGGGLGDGMRFAGIHVWGPAGEIGFAPVRVSATILPRRGMPRIVTVSAH
jgi:hypothetical protein